MFIAAVRRALVLAILLGLFLPRTANACAGRNCTKRKLCPHESLTRPTTLNEADARTWRTTEGRMAELQEQLKNPSLGRKQRRRIIGELEKCYGLLANLQAKGSHATLASR